MSVFGTHLKTKRVQPSHTQMITFGIHSEKEQGQYIISQRRLSNLLSFFLRKTSLFLSCDPTVTGRQQAETAERNFEEKEMTSEAITNTHCHMLTHRSTESSQI